MNLEKISWQNPFFFHHQFSSHQHGRENSLDRTQKMDHQICFVFFHSSFVPQGFRTEAGCLVRWRWVELRWELRAIAGLCTLSVH